MNKGVCIVLDTENKKRFEIYQIKINFVTFKNFKKRVLCDFTS